MDKRQNNPEVVKRNINASVLVLPHKRASPAGRPTAAGISSKRMETIFEEAKDTNDAFDKNIIIDSILDEIESENKPEKLFVEEKEETLTWLDIGVLYKEYKRRIGYITPDEEPEKDRKLSKKKQRAWFLTLNNPRQKEFEALDRDSEKLQYCLGHLEACPKTGTLHLHIILYYPNCVVCPIKKYPRAVIQQPDNLYAVINYVKKDKSRVLGPWEWGTAPGQGARTDLDKLKNDIMEGKTTVEEIVLDNPVAYHEYGRTLTKIEDIRMSRMFRTECTLCVWFKGATATGKSTRAYTNYSTKTHYNYPYDGKWWDNYRQQPIVVVNEFRGDADIQFSEMLELIDVTPKEVSRRNRAPLPFTSRLVIVTCPVGPEKVYGRIDKEDNFAQFARRCVVIELTKQFISTKTDEEKITEMKSLFKTITGEDAKLFENFG